MGQVPDCAPELAFAELVSPVEKPPLLLVVVPDLMLDLTLMTTSYFFSGGGGGGVIGPGIVTGSKDTCPGPHPAFTSLRIFMAPPFRRLREGREYLNIDASNQYQNEKHDKGTKYGKVERCATRQVRCRPVPIARARACCMGPRGALHQPGAGGCHQLR